MKTEDDDGIINNEHTTMKGKNTTSQMIATTKSSIGTFNTDPELADENNERPLERRRQEDVNKSHVYDDIYDDYYKATEETTTMVLTIAVVFSPRIIPFLATQVDES